MLIKLIVSIWNCQMAGETDIQTLFINRKQKEIIVQIQGGKRGNCQRKSF